MEIGKKKEKKKRQNNGNSTNYFQLNEQNKYFHTLYFATIHHIDLLTHVLCTYPMYSYTSDWCSGKLQINEHSHH